MLYTLSKFKTGSTCWYVKSPLYSSVIAYWFCTKINPSAIFVYLSIIMTFNY